MPFPAPAACSTGLVYSEQTPSCQATCQSVEEYMEKNCVNRLVPGCKCGDGLYLSDGKCLQLEECPCTYQHLTYNPGEIIKIKCNNW